MTPPGDRDQESLEAPAYLGRPRYEGPVRVSPRSIGGVGVVALVGLVGAIVGLTTNDNAAAWIGLGVFLIFAVGYVLLIRQSVRRERDEERRMRERR